MVKIWVEKFPRGSVTCNITESIPATGEPVSKALSLPKSVKDSHDGNCKAEIVTESPSGSEVTIS